MIKTYVLDTNVLMSTEGKVISGFDDNNVVITHTTLEELDKFKMAPGERGYQAREAIRAINSIIEQKSENESVLQGIKIPACKGIFRITAACQSSMPKGWSADSPDNRILSACKNLEDTERCPVILITNDVSLSIKAQMLNLAVQGYYNDNVNTSESYTGRGEISIPYTDFATLYDRGEVSFETNENIPARKYFLIHNSDKPNDTALGYYLDNKLHIIRYPDNTIYGVTPKNIGQKFALHALLAPAEEIPLVILKGPAGCGKTLLSLAAGLQKTYEWKREDMTYNGIVITRSNTLSDEEIGFLPGTLEDKMGPLVSPFMDNLRFLLSHSARGEEKHEINMQIDDMLETGVLEITSLAYIRGRSLNNTFLICDEFQNSTRIQAKTLVTRMGMGSKLVILGDPDQIDNPKLDKKNNGLAFLSERFAFSPLAVDISFNATESVRSPLSLDAIMRLE